MSCVYIFCKKGECYYGIQHTTNECFHGFSLHVIPIDESTTVLLGRELLYGAIGFW